MKRFSRRSGMTTLSEINVTPLLDLAFVLLIIFIITTPLIENSMDLIVPTSAVTQDGEERREPVIVEVNAQGEFRVDGKVVASGDLEGLFQTMSRNQPDLGVVVRAHRDLPVQILVDIMDALKRARITRVGVLTQAPEWADAP